MILYQKGPDDMATFYTFVIDKENPDRYSTNGKIIDRFNRLTWDKFLEIDNLAINYKGSKDEFMEEFRKLFIG